MAEDVINRFRELASDWHAANAAAAGAQERLNTVLRGRFQLVEQRRRLATVRYYQTDSQARHLDELARLDREIAKASDEVARLTAERDALQERAGNAGTIASNARDYLVDHRGISRAELGL